MASSSLVVRAGLALTSILSAVLMSSVTTGGALQANSTLPLDLALVPLSDLTVEISGLRNQSGLVCIALFDNPNGFPSDGTKAIKNNCFKIAAATQNVSLGLLKPGKYAMSVLHDENADRKLNTGFLGIPKEGIGFSQNPRIRRQLQFDETSFDFRPNASTVQVRIKYF